MTTAPTPAETLAEVVPFWRASQPHWFAKSDAFDDDFRTRFMAAHERAVRGELDAAATTPEAALGLVILLDQFPRNSFRDTPRMYASDPLARERAARAIAAGLDQGVEPALQAFFYLPFSHSENLADQDRSVELNTAIGDETLRYAKGHREIVRRFGRFPHRNAILGRTSTPQELAFLADGGFAG